ncbi:hypothetical protein BTVI_50218 [Pitangus sulphuratus]|nr:hypothetical protein BTVI_50218 [Pitangus sulphuratus]
MQRQTEEKFRMWIEKLTRLDTDEESKQQLEPREPKIQLVGQRIPPTTQSGAFIQMPDSQVLPQQSFNSYVGYQSVDATLEFPATFNNNFPPIFPENGNIAEPDCGGCFSKGAVEYLNDPRAGNGPPIVAHYDISDTNSDPEVVNVDNLLAAAVVQEHNSSLGNQESGSAWRTRGLLDEMSADTGCLDPGFLAGDITSSGNAQANEEINIASSDSEVEIVGVQEHARCVHPRGGVIQSVSSWKRGSQFINAQQTQPWTAVAPQQNWSSPPEVVDLTLDEDTRRKFLL